MLNNQDSKINTTNSNETEDDIIIHDTIGMNNPYRYRNKVQLPVGEKDGEVKIGFYAQRSHEIIHMDSCDIQDETADKVVELIKAVD